MASRIPDHSSHTGTQNGARTGDTTTARTQTQSVPPSPLRGFLVAFLGTLAALVFFGVMGVGIYYGFRAVHILPGSATTAPGAAWSTPTTTTTSVPPPPLVDSKPKPVVKAKDPFTDPATWVLGAEPAQTLTGDAASDIGWWAEHFDLPNEQKVSDFLKAQGLTVSHLAAIYYDDTKDATTITYQVNAEVPTSLYRVPKATWAPGNPEMKPFAALLVLNRDLPAGQFWNTRQQTVATEAGTKLDFAWKVTLDKNAHAVTTDRLPGDADVFTQEQSTQLQAETDNIVALLQGKIQAINARVQGDVQGRLAQVPTDPPRPQLMSTEWNSGDGSGEPTRSAERIGGGAAAGAAGGAAFGAAAGNAGEGAGIGAGVGLLGGIIYDAVSKNNDKERYRRRAEAENQERLRDWKAQLKSLAQQRAQIKKDGGAEKQHLMQELASSITAAGGHLDGISGSISPEPFPPISDAPPADQPSGAYDPAPQAGPAPTSDQASGVITADQPSGTIHAPTPGAGGGSAPVKVDLIYEPGEQNPSWGNVQVIYADGSTELLTQDNKSCQPRLSGTGRVGWVQITGTPPKADYKGNQDFLMVRSLDGSVRKYEPNNRFIEKWDFTDGDSTVVMADMSYHGPMSFTRYDLRSGQKTGDIVGYVEHSQLPDWAKPLDDL